MGSPFSAQAAHLHSLWCVFQKSNLFRQLGTLIVSETGFPYWVGEHTVALVQFRDNTLMANEPPPPPPQAWASLVENVRGILQKAWGLVVVCDCITEVQIPCTEVCRDLVCKAVGVVMVRGGGAADDPLVGLGPGTTPDQPSL